MFVPYLFNVVSRVQKYTEQNWYDDVRFVPRFSSSNDDYLATVKIMIDWLIDWLIVRIKLAKKEKSVICS